MAPPGRSSVSDIRSRGRRARLSGPHAKAPMEGATERTFRFIPDLLRDCRDGESGSGQFTSGKIEPQSGKKCEWCQPRRPLEHAHKTGARGIGACGKFVQGPAFRGIIQHRGHRPPSLPMREESQKSTVAALTIEMDAHDHDEQCAREIGGDGRGPRASAFKLLLDRGHQHT